MEHKLNTIDGATLMSRPLQPLSLVVDTYLGTRLEGSAENSPPWGGQAERLAAIGGLGAKIAGSSPHPLTTGGNAYA